MQIAVLQKYINAGHPSGPSRLTSKDTNCSARLRVLVTCQKMLAACFQPVLVGLEKLYASRSGPPFGKTIIQYVCDREKVSNESSI
jgi:hypothetical protein